MLLKTFKPSLPLREFVEFFRIVHFRLDGLHMPVKFYPQRPEHCLAFYPFDREKIYFGNDNKMLNVPPVMLSGQQLHMTRRLLQGQNFLILHIMFQPTALYRLTGIAANEFNNDFHDATLVFGDAIRHINDALAEACNYTRMIEIAEAYVLSLIKSRCKEAHTLDSICAGMGSWPRLSVEEAARKSYLSSRQLQRKFFERTGLTPKLFDRATRFHHTIDLRLKNPGITWTDIAYKSGYCDYQHLVRDYHYFTGMTPTSYQVLDSQSPERKLGLADKSYKENSGGFLV